MRVDDVPLWLRPAFHAFGCGGALVWQTLIETTRRTCTVERTAIAPCPGVRIECIWHEHLPAYVATALPPRDGRRYVWMNHPIWYMRPVHVFLEWNGVTKLELGSTGHGGKQALERIVANLSKGMSTLVAVDGPGGPIRVVKRGALDMSIASGLPIVAIRYEYERAVRAPGWDQKWFAAPGSRIRIIESEPIFVTTETYETCRMRLAAALG